MMTLKQFSRKPETIPAAAAWYLADLAEARGRQALFTQQTHQKLKALRENALIESAVSSNRIEGVRVDQARVRDIVLGQGHLRDRNEEEVRGYRNALNLIHEQGSRLPISEKTVRELHRLARGEIGDAGQYKKRDSNIIERYPDVGERVRFKTVSAKETPHYLRKLVELWDQSLEEQWVHPLITLAAFNLDFLCIHPFRDGNGRVSRLLLLLQSYHLGFEAGRYISLERLVEQNKERYYETLEQSSEHWHEGRHNPWPCINYLLFILKTAYREFEERLSRVKPPRGAKTELVRNAIERTNESFHISDIQRECSDVSIDMIRKVLKKLRSEGLVECLGRGPNAQWKRCEG